MALWHLLARNIRGIWVPVDGAQPWDDGATQRPGESDFTTAMIETQAAPDRRFNYIGTPNWKAV